MAGWISTAARWTRASFSDGTAGMKMTKTQQKALEAVLREVLNMFGDAAVKSLVRGKANFPDMEDIMYAMAQSGLISVVRSELRPESNKKRVRTEDDV